VVVPNGWTRNWSKIGRLYYANHETKETRWTPPEGSTWPTIIQTQLRVKLSDGWEERSDVSGLPLYVNMTTKKWSSIRPWIVQRERCKKIKFC